MLTLPELMKSENLIFKDTENLSYVPHLHGYKYYDEIDSETAYHLFQQKITGKKDAVQIPFSQADPIHHRFDLIPILTGQNGDFFFVLTLSDIIIFAPL